MQDESKPTNEPTPKPKRTLEEFYQETRAERDLIAARRRLQDSLNQKQGGPPMPDEGKSKKPEPPKPEPKVEPKPEPAEPTTADLYARRPRKRKAVVDQLARELEAEDDAAAADAPKGGDE